MRKQSSKMKLKKIVFSTGWAINTEDYYLLNQLSDRTIIDYVLVLFTQIFTMKSNDKRTWRTNGRFGRRKQNRFCLAK